jgi:hypothetical protein
MQAIAGPNGAGQAGRRTPPSGALKNPLSTGARRRVLGIAAYAGSGGTGSSRAGRSRGRLPASRIAAISAVLTVMAFAVVACSSSSPGSTPDPGSSPITTAQLVGFAHCMRSHDVKNFPDPVNGGFSFSRVGPDSVDPSSPAFQAAKAACIHLVPGEAQRPTVTAQDLAAGDKLAACMRSHGFPSFPDPTSQNVFDVPKSINIALPSYQSAFSTCQSQAHDNNGVFPGAAKSGQGS